MILILLLGSVCLSYQAHQDYRQFRDGDILIGGAIEVHRYAGNGNCGELRDKGVQDVELINMLIENTNKNKNILRGIKLGTVLIDTCAWPSHALEKVFYEILPFLSNIASKFDLSCNSTTKDKEKRILAGILGPATSKVALQVANQLEMLSIPQVSHSATLQELSDKSVYPNFFRTVPPHYHLIQATLDLATELEWNYISMVYDNDCYGLDAFQTLANSIENRNICLATSVAIPKSDHDEEFERIAQEILKKGEANAVFLYTTSVPAAKVMSAVQRLSNNNNSIVWIGGDGWTSYLPVNEENDSYVDGLDGSIGYSAYGKHLDAVDEYMTRLTLEKRQGDEFQLNPWFSELIASQNGCSLENGAKIRKCRADERLSDNFTSYDGLLNVENAFMSFVYALDAYHRDICQNKSGMCEELLRLSGTNVLAKQLRIYLQNVSFVDSSGRNFFFDEYQDGPASYFIYTFEKSNIVDSKKQRQGWKRIGTYMTATIWGDKPKKASNTSSICSAPCKRGEETITDSKQKCCWTCRPCSRHQFVSPNTSSCESCPKMMTSNTKRNGCKNVPTKAMKYHSTYSIIGLAIGCFGIVLTFIVTGIYIKWRKCAIVRASGGELCFIVLFGVLMTFCNCFAIGAPATFASCFAARFILSFGPTTMNAALLVKTLRVVIIFKYKTELPDKLKAVLQTGPQVCIIVCIIFLDGILFTVWTVQDPPTPVWDFASQEHFFQACPGISTIRIFVGLVFPFLIIIVCTIFATINRKVPAGFNETLYIGLTMYTTCVIWLAFLPLFLVNEKNIPLKMTTTSICLSCSALAVLLCVFLPRCYKILFCPEENTRKAIMSTPNTQEQNAKTTTQNDERA